jgi:hypothetical protein
MPLYDGKSVSARKTGGARSIYSWILMARLCVGKLADDLAGIHDALWIERLLDRPHDDKR